VVSDGRTVTDTSGIDLTRAPGRAARCGWCSSTSTTSPSVPALSCGWTPGAASTCSRRTPGARSGRGQTPGFSVSSLTKSTGPVAGCAV